MFKVSSLSFMVFSVVIFTFNSVVVADEPNLDFARSETSAQEPQKCSPAPDPEPNTTADPGASPMPSPSECLLPFACDIDVYYRERQVPASGGLGGIVWDDGDCQGKAAAVKDFLARAPKPAGSKPDSAESCDQDCTSPAVCMEKTLQIDSKYKIYGFDICHPKKDDGSTDYNKNYYCIRDYASERGKTFWFTVGCGCCQ